MWNSTQNGKRAPASDKKKNFKTALHTRLNHSTEDTSETSVSSSMLYVSGLSSVFCCVRDSTYLLRPCQRFGKERNTVLCSLVSASSPMPALVHMHIIANGWAPQLTRACDVRDQPITRLTCLIASSLVWWCVKASLGLSLRVIFWKSTFSERSCSWTQSCFLPTSTARQDALHCRGVSVNRTLHVVPELSAEVRFSKNTATNFKRCDKFGFGSRRSNSCWSP